MDIKRKNAISRLWIETICIFLDYVKRLGNDSEPETKRRPANKNDNSSPEERFSNNWFETDKVRFSVKEKNIFSQGRIFR